MGGTEEAYAVLGLRQGAPAHEVKAAYRRLALLHHPDVSKGSGEQFKRITSAYSALLGRPSLRHRSPARQAAAGAPPGAAARRPPYRGVQHAFQGRAATVWGVGLALGCVMFGGALLLGKTEMYSHNLYHKGGRRVIEPTTDSVKRERIANLLLEKARQGPPVGGKSPG